MTKAAKAVISPAVSNMCAVMAFDGKTINLMKNKFGDKAAFFSPLQENMAISDRLNMSAGGCIVNLTESNFYITAFGDGGKLQIAEVYPCQSAADAVYYLHSIIEGAGGSDADARIYLYGSRAEDSIRTIRKYFGGALCV
jgi:hypothetical protein